MKWRQAIHAVRISLASVYDLHHDYELLPCPVPPCLSGCLERLVGCFGCVYDLDDVPMTHEICAHRLSDVVCFVKVLYRCARAALDT